MVQGTGPGSPEIALAGHVGFFRPRAPGSPPQGLLRSHTQRTWCAGPVPWCPCEDWRGTSAVASAHSAAGFPCSGCCWKGPHVTPEETVPVKVCQSCYKTERAAWRGVSPCH